MDADSRAPLAHVMDLLLDAVCVVDATGCFASITGACERIFGYAPEEMIGQPMINFVYADDRARTLQAVEKIMSGYLQRHFENRYVRKDGTVVDIMWSARWSEADQVRVAVARDVTGHRRSEIVKTVSHATPDAAPCWRLSASPPRLIPPGFAPISLSAQDYTVLLAIARGGQRASRESIVHALGESFLEYDQRRLDTQMRRLRRKVEESCGMQLPVTTLRGVSFHFYDEIEICR